MKKFAKILSESNNSRLSLKKARDERSRIETKTRAGFVAILGAPNAGKSTLVNCLVGQKVSIVTPKAQTTRIRTLGIMSEDEVQISFIDTPGIFAPKSRLDRAMVKTAWNSLEDADAIVLIVDAAARKENEKIAAIVEELQYRKKSVILALNKVDAMVPAKLLPQATALDATGVFSDIFMISALTGDGVNDLKDHLKKMMPESPWFYGEDQISDLPSQILASEITREQLFLQLQQELPYAAAVLPGTLEEKNDGSIVICQNIVVARANHRPMVLGKGGTRIKTIGEKARAEISRVFERKVHLFLEVKVDEKWQDHPDFYRTFGLDFGKE
jgi:GTP-binding protein Era